MTEEQIEHEAERKMDHLDRLLMTGAFSQAEYDHAVKELNAWVDIQYAYLKSA